MSGSADSLRGARLAVASHNAGKIREIQTLLAPFGVETLSAGDLGLDAPDETETTFEGNALIKARAVAAAGQLPALADDSGLAIDALGGAPGVYTADWAETGDGRDFGVAMARAHHEIQAVGALEPWTARFVSVLAVAWPDGRERTFRGEIDGRVIWPPRGENGFGYDPMFIRDGESQTFGELTFEQKYADNHRTRAFAALVAALFDPS